MPKTDIDITELEEFEPSRVDGVGKAANGFPILMLKSEHGEVTETETDLDGALAEIGKAEDDASDREDCATCGGDGKIKGNTTKCPDCMGSGIKPQPGDTEKSLLEVAAARKASDGVAASGVPVPPADKCPTCKGTGMIGENHDTTCTDCDGSGKDASMPKDSKLNAVDGDPGKITVGDAQGREAIDKSADKNASNQSGGSIELAPVIAHLTADTAEFVTAISKAQDIIARYGVTETEYLEKRNMDPDVGGGVDRDKIDAADFAGKDRSFPIVKPGDVSDAASSIGRAGPDNYSSDKLKSNIIAIAKRKGASFVAQLPKAWIAEKAMGDGVTFSAPNPALAAAATQVTDTGSSDDDASSDPTDATIPGSPAWEAIDAQMATDAALALMTAVELLRSFANRETQEVVAGDASDSIDVYMVTEAICAAQSAIGVAAQLAFHEGLEAAKGLPDDEVVEKAGRRLAGKTVTALATARDKAKDLANHISGVLGDDDPAKKSSDTDEQSSTKKFIENANKAILAIDQAKLAEELETMSTDEFEKALEARDEKLVGLIAEALKGAKTIDQDVDHSDSIAGAKDANNKAKTKKPKADMTDLEDEADQGDNDSASSPATGAAKGEEFDKPEDEMTEDELEAKKQFEAAKAMLKEAKQARKQAAKDAAVAKEIKEGIAEATAAFDTLQDRLGTMDELKERLATVEKMSAPTNIVRSAPVEAQTAAKARDEIELEVSRLESLARNTNDREVRKAYEDRARDERAKLTASTDVS